MTDRNFRFLFGLLLLLALYVDSRTIIMALIAGLVFEGATDWRLSSLVSRLRYGRAAAHPRYCGLSLSPLGPRIPFDAERAWRLVVAGMLILACLAFPRELWFFPWFMGFAIFGAGVSGVCPVLLMLQLSGFRQADAK